MQDYFGQITALAFSPDDAGVLYMGGRSFYRWDIQGSAPDPFYARGLGSYRLELLINRPAEPGAIFATHGPWDGMFVSSDQGKNWREAGTSPLAFKADRTVLGVAGGRLQNSTDDALTWDPGPSIPGVERLQSIAAHPYLLNLYFALYAGGIRYSRDAGETWEDVQGLQQISDPRLFFDYAQGLRVYAVGDQQVYRSDSYGMSWERCGELPVGTWISSYEMRAAVGLVKEDQIFIATRGMGILFSEDGCRTWETLNNNLGSLYVNTIAVRPGFSTRLWAATDGGAYYSWDRGYNWSQVNNGLLGTNIVYSIVVDKGGQAYASTPSGVYRLVGLDG
jgi:hypothetical protein